MNSHHFFRSLNAYIVNTLQRTVQKTAQVSKRHMHADSKLEIRASTKILLVKQIQYSCNMTPPRCSKTTLIVSSSLWFLISFAMIIITSLAWAIGIVPNAIIIASFSIFSIWVLIPGLGVLAPLKQSERALQLFLGLATLSSLLCILIITYLSFKVAGMDISDVDTAITSFNSDAIASYSESNPEGWISLQDNLNCCGFTEDQGPYTGIACNNTVHIFCKQAMEKTLLDSMVVVLSILGFVLGLIVSTVISGSRMYLIPSKFGGFAPKPGDRTSAPIVARWLNRFSRGFHDRYSVRLARMQSNETFKKSSIVNPAFLQDDIESVGSGTSTASSVFDPTLVFQGKNIKLRSPSMVQSLMEGAIYSFGAVSRLPKVEFSGAKNVIVHCPVEGGDGPLLSALSMLRMQQVGADTSEHMPLVESKEFDDAIFKLSQPQPGSFSVYRTLQAIPLRSTEAKFIAVVRDPSDYRLAWYRYLEDCYESERQGNKRQAAFKDCFSPSDFAGLPSPLCAGRANVNSPMDYEAFLAEWFNYAIKGNYSNALIVFYEDLLLNTADVLEDIASFLDVPLDPALKEGMTAHLSFENLMETYGIFHDFHVNKTRIGEGSKELDSAARNKVENSWRKNVRTRFPELKSFRDYYKAVTGRS